MKKVRPKSRARVVEGTVSAVQYPLERAQGPAAELRKPNPNCPLCRTRVATTEVTIGIVTVKVCAPCSDPVFSGLQFFGALVRAFQP